MSAGKKETVRKKYNRIAPFYDKLESMMEKGKMGTWREELWKRVAETIPAGQARLLEAGVGTGKNIQYYPDGVELYGIDFSEKMLEQARKKAASSRKYVRLEQMDIQNMDFPDNHFDIIVTTCVFCSVPDPIVGLQELKRVCKEDGKMLMLEHMRTEAEPWGTIMDALNWVSLYTWGANINRRTLDNLAAAGWQIVEVEDLLYDVVREIVLKPC